MEKTKTCPYCGEEILAIAKKCKHCGEWLKEDIPCPVCGESIQADATVCPVCGEPISQEEDIPTELPTLETETLESSCENAVKEDEYASESFLSFYGVRIWKKYCFKSSDSVSRGEYWKFILVTSLTSYFAIACLAFVTTIIATFVLGGESTILNSAYAILTLGILIFTMINCICMSIRRLHDTGRGGWWLFLSCFPIVDIIILVFLCKKGVSADQKVKAKAQDIILLISMFLLGTLALAGASVYGLQAEEQEEIAPSVLAVDKTSNENQLIGETDNELEPISELLQCADWEKHDDGFQVPTFMTPSKENLYDGECWTYGNVCLVYWSYLANWATYEFPTEDNYLMEDVLVYDITYQNSSSTIFSGHTSDGRIWYMKKKIYNDSDVPCASALAVIYPEDPECDMDTFIKIVKNW